MGWLRDGKTTVNGEHENEKENEGDRRRITKAGDNAAVNDECEGQAKADGSHDADGWNSEAGRGDGTGRDEGDRRQITKANGEAAVNDGFEGRAKANGSHERQSGSTRRNTYGCVVR